MNKTIFKEVSTRDLIVFFNNLYELNKGKIDITENKILDEITSRVLNTLPE